MATLHLYASKASECNILQFMACKFDGNFKVLTISGEPSDEQLIKAWDDINTEYLDLSGTFIPELSKMKEIKTLECRNQSVHVVLQVLNQSVALLENPVFNNMHDEIIETMIEALPVLEKNARKLNWNNDIPDFKQQLHRAETGEKRYLQEYNKKLKELEDFRTEQSKAKTPSNNRTEFIRLLNELQKFGYRIDKPTTTAEELAIMVKDYTETIERAMDKAQHN